MPQPQRTDRKPPASRTEVDELTNASLNQLDDAILQSRKLLEYLDRILAPLFVEPDGWYRLPAVESAVALWLIDQLKALGVLETSMTLNRPTRRALTPQQKARLHRIAAARSRLRKRARRLFTVESELRGLTAS